jgi:uncharacterized delta-60 repeat protein
VSRHLALASNRLAGLLVVISALIATPVALAAPGDLDRTFDGDGRVTSNFTKWDDFGKAVARQADGKIVVAGDVVELNDFEHYPAFILERRKPDGALDRSFGNDGRVITRWFRGELTHAGASALAIQADGKIVAAGFVYGTFGGGCCHTRIALARYRADGTLDPTFGGDGRVTTSFTPGLGLGPEAHDVAIQPDGKIVAVGNVYPTESKSTGTFALVRYNPDGTLDSTFGGDGRVVTDMTSGEDVAVAVAIQADGSIIAAGKVAPLNGVDTAFGLARYEPNGALDSTFGEGGQVTTDFTTGPDRAEDVVLQADGKVVAAGAASAIPLHGRFALARYNTDGTLDTSFSGDGKVATNFSSKSDMASAVAVQATGKIVAAGGASASRKGGSLAFFALARYNADGTLDTSFSGDGKVTTNFTNSRDWALDVAVQANGRIVAAGIAGYDSPERRAGRIALARYRGG